MVPLYRIRKIYKLYIINPQQRVILSSQRNIYRMSVLFRKKHKNSKKE